jgi:hypothetical protein
MTQTNSADPALMALFPSAAAGHPSAAVVMRDRMTARAIRRKASRNRPRKAPQTPQTHGKGFGG